jgi:adenylylsulfate kinase-like enzyme
MSDVERFVREYLSRRDPQGYYVILARKESKDMLAGISGIIVEEVGDMVIVRTRSRSIAEKVIRLLAKRGLLA